MRGFAIDHPDEVIVVDTGVGTGHPFIDDLGLPVGCRAHPAPERHATVRRHCPDRR